jgi:hypothetical protein
MNAEAIRKCDVCRRPITKPEKMIDVDYLDTGFPEKLCGRASCSRKYEARHKRKDAISHNLKAPVSTKEAKFLSSKEQRMLRHRMKNRRRRLEREGDTKALKKWDSAIEASKGDFFGTDFRPYN